MTAVSKKQLRVYLAELAIIVFGILIAFQVEEWRDERRNEQDMQASLQRLAEETRANLAFCERILRNQRRVTAGVEQAFLSLRIGILRDQDVTLFESGITLAAQLPNYSLLTTVADEMISTGLLREIDDVDLRQLVASVHIMQRSYNLGYPSRRASVRDLSNEMFGHVDIEFVDPTSVLDAERVIVGSLEYETQVLYDFEEMAQNKRLKNHFFEALDSHVDQLRGTERLCGYVADIDDRLSLAVSD